MTFTWYNARFATVAQFTSQYLSSLTRPTWLRGATIHNTYRPDLSMWLGHQSMRNLLTFYRDTKKWSAGPHLFVSVGADVKNDDGIFVGTPLHLQGVHAGDCNINYFGIEVVGDFERDRWSNDQLVFVTDLLVAICEWAKLNPLTNINTHNICMPGRTCPGQYTDINQLRQITLAKMQDKHQFSWNKWGAHVPLDPAARNFAIPSKWSANNNWKLLGQCVSQPVYDVRNTGDCVQMFEHGLISYHAKSNVAMIHEYE